MPETDLSLYDNSWYSPGPLFKRGLWYVCSLLFFTNAIFPFYPFKVFLLRRFGARVGEGVFIKPFVKIKYPWLLSIGNHCWLGEQVWIDNLAPVIIHNNVCISQGAMLLCGNHDFNSSKFDLKIGKIELEDGVWIGARAIVCPGIVCRSHAVLSAGSVATKEMEAYSIYQGNPALKVKTRVIRG